MCIGKDCVEVFVEQVLVNIGGVKVLFGDLIVGDDDGVVCVFCDIEDEVFCVVVEIDECEDVILVVVFVGKLIVEVCVEQGYYILQCQEKWL